MSRRTIRHVRAAAAYLVLAPAAVALVLLLGGEQFQGCLSLHCQPVSTPGPIPILGTTAGSLAVSAVLGVAAILAAATLLNDLIRNHRRAVVRLVLVVGVATAAAAILGVAVGWSTGHRLRAAVETAAWWAGGAALLGSVLGIAAASWTTTRPEPGSGTGITGG